MWNECAYGLMAVGVSLTAVARREGFRIGNSGCTMSSWLNTHLTVGGAESPALLLPLSPRPLGGASRCDRTLRYYTNFRDSGSSACAYDGIRAVVELESIPCMKGHAHLVG